MFLPNHLATSQRNELQFLRNVSFVNHSSVSTWKGHACYFNPRRADASLVDDFQIKRFLPMRQPTGPTGHQNGPSSLPPRARATGQPPSAPPPYLSNKCVRVEFMALSTVAIASTMDVATNGSPFRLTSGTRRTGGCTLPAEHWTSHSASRRYVIGTHGTLSPSVTPASHTRA